MTTYYFETEIYEDIAHVLSTLNPDSVKSVNIVRRDDYIFEVTLTLIGIAKDTLEYRVEYSYNNNWLDTDEIVKSLRVIE